MKHPPRNIVIDWLNTVWSTDLESNSKLIACNLRRYMNSQHDMAWPSVSRIAGECGLSDNCVRKHLKILCSEGWLVHSGTSQLETNIYQASYPPAIIEGVQPLRSPPATIAAKLNNVIKQDSLSKGFTRPTVDQVSDYCNEKGYSIDPETFVNYYNSNGWKVGRASMKCWKSATTNWNKREQKRENTKTTSRTQNTRRLSPTERAIAARAAATDRQRATNGSSNMGHVVDHDE